LPEANNEKQTNRDFIPVQYTQQLQATDVCSLNYSLFNIQFSSGTDTKRKAVDYILVSVRAMVTPRPHVAFICTKLSSVDELVTLQAWQKCHYPEIHSIKPALGWGTYPNTQNECRRPSLFSLKLQ